MNQLHVIKTFSFDNPKEYDYLTNKIGGQPQTFSTWGHAQRHLQSLANKDKLVPDQAYEICHIFVAK